MHVRVARASRLSAERVLASGVRRPLVWFAALLPLVMAGGPFARWGASGAAVVRAPVPVRAVIAAPPQAPVVAPAAVVAPPTVLGEIEAPPCEQDALPEELIARVRAEAPDVLVVLGAKARRGQPGRHLRQRLVAAVHLFNALDRRPTLVLSGGRGEAQAMRDFLLARGVPRAQMILETHSRSTVQNARYSMAILARHPDRFHAALLVTTAIRWRRGRIDDHARRALHDFAQYCPRNLRVSAVNINVGPRIEPRVYVANTPRERGRGRGRHHS